MWAVRGEKVVGAETPKTQQSWGTICHFKPYSGDLCPETRFEHVGVNLINPSALFISPDAAWRGAREKFVSPLRTFAPA